MSPVKLPQAPVAGVQGSGGFGVVSNRFGFNFTSSSGLPVTVEASTDLIHWQTLQTSTFTGSACFADAQWTNYPGRYYRLVTP